MALFDDCDVIIQQQKVGYSLNLAEWLILSKHISYTKIKSFYTLNPIPPGLFLVPVTFGRGSILPPSKFKTTKAIDMKL